MKQKSKAVQLAMHYRCGREPLLVHGMCATCYTLRCRDEEYFGGLREAVLEKDGYDREPGHSVLELMISLCPACLARVHRTQALKAMPRLLLVLCREQHP